MKLHGCISEFNSVSTFLPIVASRRNVMAVRNVIIELLTKFEYVLVMGYSFSDAYDIVKVAKEIVKYKKRKTAELIVVKHCRKGEEEKYYDTIQEYLEAKKKEKKPSKIPPEFNGFVLKCNTDRFVKEAWQEIVKDEHNTVHYEDDLANKEYEVLISRKYSDAKEKCRDYVKSTLIDFGIYGTDIISTYIHGTSIMKQGKTCI